MDDFVKKAVEHSMIRKPSKGFTDRVMEQVFELKTSKPYQPIISKRTWIVLGSLSLAGLIALLWVPAENVQETGTLTFIDKITKFTGSIDFSGIEFFNNINLLLIAGISLAIFLLLFFDSYITKKR